MSASVSGLPIAVIIGLLARAPDFQSFSCFYDIHQGIVIPKRPSAAFLGEVGHLIHPQKQRKTSASQSVEIVEGRR